MHEYTFFQEHPKGSWLKKHLFPCCFYEAAQFFCKRESKLYSGGKHKCKSISVPKYTEKVLSSVLIFIIYYEVLQM